MRTTAPTPVPVASLGTVVRSLSFAETPAPKRVHPQPIASNLHTKPHKDIIQAAIRVVLRIRPLNIRERQHSQQSCILPSTNVSVLNIRPLDPKKHPVAIRNAGKATFKFSNIFGEHSTQSHLFEQTALPLVTNLFSGSSAVVFAYGVTSSGKTWTIQGTNHHPGILPRSLDVMVNSIAKAKGRGLMQETVVSSDVEMLTTGTARRGRARKKGMDAKTHDSNYIKVDADVDYSIFASYLEVYNEQVYDLFASQAPQVKDELTGEVPSGKIDPVAEDSNAAVERHCARRKILKLKENSAGEVYAEGQRECEIRSGADIDRLLEFGQKNRTVAHTEANERSSRSHAIFIITLKQVRKVERQGKAPLTYRSSSKFYIVDLAGSERTSRTNNTGQRLKETAQINTSLMNLGRCLTVLRQNQRIRKKDPKKTLQVVPFRHSRLTRLLQESLNSGSAVMIANVSPFERDADETIHALRCAAIAREITVAPTKTRRPLADCTNTLVVGKAAARSTRSTKPAPVQKISERPTRRARARNQDENAVASTGKQKNTKQASALQKALTSVRKERDSFLQQHQADAEVFKKEKGELQKEIRILKSEKEEAILDLEAERKEADTLFRENERLKDRLIDAEARFRYMEVEIREEVTKEAEQIIKEVQERCERQVRSAMESEQDFRGEDISIMTEEERHQRAERAARRITRASTAAFDGIALNFAHSLDEDEYEEEDDNEEERGGREEGSDDIAEEDDIDVEEDGYEEEVDDIEEGEDDYEEEEDDYEADTEEEESIQTKQ